MSAAGRLGVASIPAAVYLLAAVACGRKVWPQCPGFRLETGDPALLVLDESCAIAVADHPRARRTVRVVSDGGAWRAVLEITSDTGESVELSAPLDVRLAVGFTRVCTEALRTAQPMCPIRGMHQVVRISANQTTGNALEAMAFRSEPGSVGDRVVQVAWALGEYAGAREELRADLETKLAYAIVWAEDGFWPEGTMH